MRQIVSPVLLQGNNLVYQRAFETERTLSASPFCVVYLPQAPSAIE